MNYKKRLRKLLGSMLLNYKRPYYNKYLYDFASRYVLLYKGECNPNMETNGERNFLRKIVVHKKFNCIFDIGSNEGEYSEYLVSIKPNVVVHCFEPNKAAFNILKDKFCKMDKVKCNNVALGEKLEKKLLYSNPGATTFSSFHYFIDDKDDFSELNEVTVFTLDNYCENNNINKIDLMKIDTEGHELFVLKGGRQLFEKKDVEIVQFEYGHAALPARVLFSDIVKFFVDLEYVVYKIQPSGWEKITYSPWMEGCPYANFFAVKKDSYLIEEVKKYEIISRAY